MPEILRVNHLSYTYGTGTPFEKEALLDVSFSVQAGEFVGIIGHTGSGKSTLIQHLNGLMKTGENKIFLDGTDIWNAPAEIRSVRFRIGLVFQYPEYQLFEETVYKDIAFGPKNMGLSDDEVRERVLEAAAFAGLTDAFLEKSPFELSGGEKRRCAIAGVIAMRPDVLILDEPTAGLDPEGREEILERVKRYHREKGKTVLLVSHSMEDVAKHAERILVMEKGKLRFDDTTRNVFSHAEELSAMGLALPEITEVFRRLSNAGLPLSPVYTVSEAKEALLRLKGVRPC
ncbi:energy-coupling factor transporter ATPase [Oscillospiraceae bacterium OttesenSCG-928-G22]|nr:energy-coupling factor transporter ATPase [Oscillospiraceae bacterium OttesenSCG-928-G22]